MIGIFETLPNGGVALRLRCTTFEKMLVACVVFFCHTSWWKSLAEDGVIFLGTQIV